MAKLTFLLLSLLTLLTAFTVKASDLCDENPPIAEKKITAPSPPFGNALVKAEKPFFDYCEREKILEISWETTRKAFFRSIEFGYATFRKEARNRLHIDYNELDELGIQNLYGQYLDFYNAWYKLSSEQKENKKPVVSTASSCSSSSSSSTSTMTTTAVDDDHDTADDDSHGAAASSAATPLLRQRHPTTSGSTLEVK